MTDRKIDAIRNSTVHSQDGHKIGKVADVYLDDQTGEPTFVSVKTGLFGGNGTFVPLDQAKANGEEITVPYTKDFVTDAPNIADDGNLTPEEEQRIYEYYSKNRSSAGRDGRHEGEAAAAGTAGTAGVAGTAGHDRDAKHADRDAADRTRGANDEVVAHEERLATTGKTEQRATGRVNLRKHVTTETETVEIPVRREEVHVEREKIDPNSEAARAGAADHKFGTKDENVSVTAYEERPVVDTETVATERVSLNKEVHEDTQRVSGEVRKEEIEIDEDGTKKPRR